MEIEDNYSNCDDMTLVYIYIFHLTIQNYFYFFLFLLHQNHHNLKNLKFIVYYIIFFKILFKYKVI